LRGSTVLWIAITPPGFMPASRPSAPFTTARTWSSVGTQMPTTSDRSPTSRGDFAAFAPPADELAHGLLGEVVNGRFEAGRREMSRDRLALVAESDEADAQRHRVPSEVEPTLSQITLHTLCK
jgi:hypothetical protein